MQMILHCLQYRIAFQIQTFNSISQFFKAAGSECSASLNLMIDWHRGAADQAEKVTVSFSA